jgi:hypothetical protein
VPEIQLVVGGQLQFERVGANLTVDFVQILGRGIADLELNAVAKPASERGLQRVVICNEVVIGQQRSFADALVRHTRRDIGDGVIRLAIDWTCGAGKLGLIKLPLARTMRGDGADVTEF